MHPLERLRKGGCDLVNFTTIADPKSRFMPLYVNQLIDPIDSVEKVPDN